jgi:hypothetical protein
MSVPGMNVLNAALSVLGRQRVDYYRDVGRIVNAAGRDDTLYADPVVVAGSFQPLDMRTMQTLGLDMARNWATFHAPIDVIDPTRGKSGDELEYFGRRYHAHDAANWYAQDGWTWSIWVDTDAVVSDLILMQGGFLLFTGQAGHMELTGNG